ncbi:hypothetical protein M885DRAFT_618656 [Pelagophyceae sp. CCMP2097]|nr:hypothetical protein M885DRAFT_618656 [Pelagophyceae sp. CCMP2097]
MSTGRPGGVVRNYLKNGGNPDAKGFVYCGATGCTHKKNNKCTKEMGDFLTQTLESCDDDGLLEAGESPDDDEPEEDVRKLELGIMQMAGAVSETKSAVDTYLATDWSYHKYSYARNLMAAADPLMLDAIDSALQGAQPVDVPINIAEVSFDTLYGLRDGSHLEMMRLVQGGCAPPPPRDEGQRRFKAAVEDAPAQDDMDVDAAPPAKDQTPDTTLQKPRRTTPSANPGQTKRARQSYSAVGRVA